MDTLIVALIVLAAVIAAFNSFVKAFKSGEESACGCGSNCGGCSLAKDCSDAPDKKDRIG